MDDILSRIKRDLQANRQISFYVRDDPSNNLVSSDIGMKLNASTNAAPKDVTSVLSTFIYVAPRVPTSSTRAMQKIMKELLPGIQPTSVTECKRYHGGKVSLGCLSFEQEIGFVDIQQTFTLNSGVEFATGFKNGQTIKSRHPICRHIVVWLFPGNSFVRENLRSGMAPNMVHLPRNKSARAHQSDSVFGKLTSSFSSLLGSKGD